MRTQIQKKSEAQLSIQKQENNLGSYFLGDSRSETFQRQGLETLVDNSTRNDRAI